MCLTTLQKKPMVAKEDIKVYKVLLAVFNKKDNSIIKYITPFYGMEFKRGVNIPESNESFNDCEDEKNGGWLHSFSDEYTAFSFHKQPSIIERTNAFNCLFDDERHYKPVVFEMTIPIGAKYFVGIHNDICSDKIVWNENDKQILD